MLQPGAGTAAFLETPRIDEFHFLVPTLGVSSLIDKGRYHTRMAGHRFQQIEYGILRVVVANTDHQGYPTDLSGLCTLFRPILPDIENRELVDTLKRLRPRYLDLCKYVQGRNCVDYGEFNSDDEFFYRAGFRLRRTPETDPRMQELKALVEDQKNTLIPNAPSTALRPLKSFFPTADELLAAELPHLGEILLVHLDSYQDRVRQHGQINPEYLRAMLENRNVGLGSLPPGPEYGDRQPEVTRAVMEAWNWLEREGMVTRAGPTLNWFTISSQGEQLLKRFELHQRWEMWGVERVKDDLMRGGKHILDVARPARQRAWVEEWIRMKEDRTQPANSAGPVGGVPFVAESRIEELRKLSSANYDFRKLIRLCEELNTCYQNSCFLAIAMLTRSLLDHVPPVFGKPSFGEVANNYGTRSFKEAMQHLEDGARKVADGHLHGPIRQRETLPTLQQVHFGPMLDMLLAEIVRITE